MNAATRKTSPNDEKRRATWLAFSLLTLPMLVVTGCGVGTLSPSAPITVPGAALHGSVFGGQQPVVGSVIQLYAAGSGGYGSAAVPLISSTVTTVAGGNFGITGAYTCPSPTTPVYITATGGNAGSGNNANLAMMAALGPCGNLQASTFILINELTTVGSVWALAPFLSGPASMGTSSSNALGLANAFADVNTLVNTATGTTPGAALPGGATAPLAEINTLADILSYCVNSSGGTATNTPCGMFFTAATPAGGSAPTDTITAAVDIARNPGHNVSSLFLLTPSTAPFQPTLTVAPNDFTIAVNFTGGNFSSPSALAADASGNVWITNSGGNTVTELSHTGAVLSNAGYTASLSAPSAIAFSTDGSAWVTNKGNNTVSRLTGAGTPFNGSPYSGGSLNLPSGIAFDSSGTAWISNSGGTALTSITATGIVNSFTPAGLTAAVAVAVTPH